jgi:putative PIN family toxin of toxin-antitoxin system
MRADRLVVDTNVLISALLSPTGRPRRILNQFAAIDSTLLFSDESFAELAMRLAKPKFDPYRTTEQMGSFLDWLVELGEWIEPALDSEACRDSDDNKFLAIACFGETDCLITGDADLLVLNPFEGLPILTPTEFLARWADEQP